MDLANLILDVLDASDEALTFKDIIEGVMRRIEPDVRAALNKLPENRARRLVGGRDQPWRYQAVPITRRL